jgi:hypothetical protein
VNIQQFNASLAGLVNEALGSIVRREMGADELVFTLTMVKADIVRKIQDDSAKRAALRGERELESWLSESLLEFPANLAAKTPHPARPGSLQAKPVRPLLRAGKDKPGPRARRR